jgi:hypothetical protein
VPVQLEGRLKDEESSNRCRISIYAFLERFSGIEDSLGEQRDKGTKSLSLHGGNNSERQ